MEYKNFFEKCLKNSINNVEVNELTNENISIEIYNKKLENYEVSNITNWIIKGTINHKKVQVQTENFNEKEIIKKLIKNSNNIEIETSEKVIIKKDLIYQNHYQDDNIELIQRRMLNLYNNNDNIEAINAIYNINVTKRKIINNNNVMEDIHKTYNFYVEVIAKDKDKQVSFANSKGNVKDINIEKVTQETVNTALSKLNEGNFNAGQYKVLIKGSVLAQILNYFISSFSAEHIQKNISFLTDKYEKKIFSNKLTIIEDPNNKNYVGKRLFDNEGTKTIYKIIIENGMFKQKLYDNKSAKKDKTTSTGNNYGNISVRNLYIKPGKKSLNEMLKNIDQGIMIDDVQGGHAGINPTNGNMSIQSEGYFIKNGTIEHSIKLFVFVCSITELLNNIIEIANDLEFNNKIVNSPSILFDKINIIK